MVDQRAEWKIYLSLVTTWRLITIAKSGCGGFIALSVWEHATFGASAPLDAPAMSTLYAAYRQALSPMIAIHTLRARAGSVRSQRSGSTKPLKLYEERLVRTKPPQGRRSNDWQTCWNRDGTVSVPAEKRASCDWASASRRWNASSLGAAFHEEVAQIEIYEELHWHSTKAVLRDKSEKK